MERGDFNNGVLVAEPATLPVLLGGFGGGEVLTVTVSAVNAVSEGPLSDPATGTAG